MTEYVWKKDTFDWFLGFFYGMTYDRDFQEVVEILMNNNWEEMPEWLQIKIVNTYLEEMNYDDDYYYCEKTKKVYERGYEPDEDND